MSAAIILTIFTAISNAALLKDIRVGEYEGFTRIVFEFDTPVGTTQILPTTQGRLKAVFGNTSPGLRRKIPIERSRHIKDLQIWNQNGKLSVVLIFDLARFRHDSFPLNHPPRIVLDIQPLKSVAKNAPAPAQPTREVADQSRQVAQSATTAPKSPSVDESQMEAEAGQNSENNAEAEPSQQRTIAEKAGPAIRSTDIKPNDTNSAEPQVQVPADGNPKATKQSNRLQFYLVVGLVLITIFILALLLLMLLSKHRWAEQKSRLSAKEFLQNQDKHIAALDARIQEQLKRYEEV